MAEAAHQSALVTGGSRGIGEAVTRALSASGFRVWVGGRNEDRVGSVAESCGGVALPFDLTRPKSVAEACKTLRSDLGGAPDVVVNAAGVFDLSALAEATMDSLEHNLRVNLSGSFLVIREFLPAMLEARSGQIINIGSVSGRKAFPGNGVYAASKFGLRGLHEVLLEEIRGTGVKASLVEPGAVNTPLWDELDPDHRSDLPNRSQMLDPEDVASAVCYLATLPSTVTIPLLQIERA